VRAAARLCHTRGGVTVVCPRYRGACPLNFGHSPGRATEGRQRAGRDPGTRPVAARPKGCRPLPGGTDPSA